MVTQVNDRGKIFTQVINKRPVDVIIHTLLHKITGKIYLVPENRVIDELNSDSQFLAVTDSQIFSLDGKKLYTSAFLSVNCDQILWVLPIEEINRE